MKKKKAPVYLVGMFADFSHLLQGCGLSDQHEENFYRQMRGRCVISSLRHLVIKYGCLLLPLLAALPLAAQDGGDPAKRTEQLLWFRYNLEIPVNDIWQLEQEVEERMFVSPWRQGEFRLRSHVIRQLGRGWSADAGIMFVWETEPIEPYRGDNSLRLEIRPHQQISYQHSLGERLSFQHSYKVEERFFEQQNSEGTYNNAGIKYERLRLKYELEVGYQLNEWLGLEVFNELVFHTGPKIGPNPFDRNEAGGGLSFKLSDSLGIDLTYNYRYNPEGLGEVVVHQHVGRFTLNHIFKQAK